MRACVRVCVCVLSEKGETFDEAFFLGICMARLMGLYGTLPLHFSVGTVVSGIAKSHHCSFSSSVVSVSSSSSGEKLLNNASPSVGSSPNSLKRRSKISFFFKQA